MKKGFIFYIILLALFFLNECSFAKIPVPDRSNNWVNDYAGIIDKDTKDYLEKTIAAIKQKTADPIEVIVAIFPSLEGWRISDFARAYGEKWRAVKGRGRDNGVILVLSLQEKQVMIGVGRNLKGILTDTVTNNIIQDAIVPEFKKGDYSQGIKKAVENIIAILDKARIPSDKIAIVITRIILIAGLIAVILWKYARSA